MAEAIPVFNPDRKLEQMTNEVVQMFDELIQYLCWSSKYSSEPNRRDSLKIPHG